MKELSIEEKAKRYDELKVTAQELEHDGCFDKITLFDLFPELKESEDERTRKEIVSAINIYCSEYYRGTKVRNDMLAWLEKQGEQKPAWSEKYIADVFEKVGLAKIVREQSNDNLTNALQDAMIELSKFIPQSTPAWSEEDEQYLLVCKNALAKYQVSDKWDATIISRWLENKLTVLQPKQEWSEEDETMVTNIIIMLKEGASLHFNKNDIAKGVDWLKSLRPQNRWKPSDELDEASYQVGVKRVLENPESYGLTKYNWKPSDKQLRQLELAIDYWKPNDTEVTTTLFKLWEDLKKLKG